MCKKTWTNRIRITFPQMRSYPFVCNVFIIFHGTWQYRSARRRCDYLALYFQYMIPSSARISAPRLTSIALLACWITPICDR